MPSNFNYNFFILLAYIVGSIPTGYWFAKYFYDIDITEHGSGNIGATNVARILGKRYFGLILFLDAFKAAITLLFIKNYITTELNYLLMVAIALLIGNAYSVFLDFRGGKGVATTFGILVTLAPVYLTYYFFISWASTYLIVRRADVASLFSIVLITFLYSLYPQLSYELFLFFMFLSGWIIFRHKNNILTQMGLRQ